MGVINKKKHSTPAFWIYGIILGPTRHVAWSSYNNLFIFVEVGQNIFNEYLSKIFFLLPAKTISLILSGPSGSHLIHLELFLKNCI